MNALGIDLTDKILIVEQAVFPGRPVHKRVFEARGGFGCRPSLMGRAVMGEFLHDGDKCRLDGDDFERLATDAEIQEALDLRKGKVSEA
jgi:hypothetical protein